MLGSNAAAPASPPPDAAKLAEAHAIINVMFPPNSRESMLTQLQSQMVTQMMPDRVAWMQGPGIKKIIDDYIAEAEAEQRAVLLKHLPDQIDAMAGAYARRFSLAELKDIDAFAHSPSGQHYLSESMAMIGDPEVAIVNAAMAADVRAVTETMAPQLKEKVIGYVKAHPELAEKIAAETK